jgi:D-sedoheptulose 7-phosphate isomerase
MNIEKIIQSSIDSRNELLKNKSLLNDLQEVANLCILCFKNDGKILLCGNGGSAADAQHIAAEFTGRFNFDRPPLYAEALHVNGSYLTAVANDYSYDVIYSRMVEAAGRKGDILIGISTSGNSPNIIMALQKAQEQGMITIGLSGQNASKMTNYSTIQINVPSSDTARIQELHILIGHIICELVEDALFPEYKKVRANN